MHLRWNGKILSAKDRSLDIQIKHQNCSQNLITEFLSLDEEMWRDRPASVPDPIRVTRGKEKFEVSSQSQLGKYLLSLKSRMTLLKAHSLKVCDN